MLGTLSEASGGRAGAAWALHNLGCVAFGQGRLGPARAQQQASLRLFRELGDDAGTARCLVATASLAGASGRPAQQAQLLGAASRLFDVTHIVLLPAERDDYDRSVAVAHAALGQDELAAAWAAGAALPLEQAVEHALSELDLSKGQ